MDSYVYRYSQTHVYPLRLWLSGIGGGRDSVMVDVIDDTAGDTIPPCVHVRGSLL